MNLAQARQLWQNSNNTLGMNHGIGSGNDNAFMVLETKVCFSARGCFAHAVAERFVFARVRRLATLRTLRTTILARPTCRSAACTTASRWSSKGGLLAPMGSVPCRIVALLFSALCGARTTDTTPSSFELRTTRSLGTTPRPDTCELCRSNLELCVTVSGAVCCVQCRLLHDTFVSYAAGRTIVGDLQAVNLTAIAGDKGGSTLPSFLSCDPATASKGTNILSATYFPSPQG